MDNNLRKLNQVLKKSVQKLKPPLKILPSDFAEQFLILPDGPSAGQKIKLYNWQYEPLNIIDNPQYQKVVFKTSAQVSKTTLMNSMLLYWLYTESSNIVIGQTTTRELNQWKSGKIEKMIDAVPELAELVTEKNSKEHTNNASQTEMKDGSFWYYVSLGSAKHLRGKSAKYILLDEIAATETDGDEGNVVRLAEQRASTFGAEAKIILSSTPTFQGDSIDIEYQNSDQRQYFIKCPHCKHEHTLEWANVLFDFEQVGNRKLPLPVSGKLHCPECRDEITESQRLKAIGNGRWIITRPEIKDVAGFHMNRMYSSITTIQDLVKEFRMAFFEYQNQTFYNTVLGLHYNEYQNDIENIALENLRDTTFDLDNIPDEVLALTLGVDQQLDRLETTVIGFTKEKIYVLGHRFFYSPNCEIRGAKAYNDLSKFIQGDFRTVTGRKLKVLKTFVDSGNGRATNTIMSYCQTMEVLGAIKGSSSTTGVLVPSIPTTSKGYPLWVLNVHEGKKMVRSLLNNALSDNPDDAPLKVLFSHDLPADYFDQLNSEELKRKGDGFRWILKTGVKRNESLDCLVYAICAMTYSIHKLGTDPFKRLRDYKKTTAATAANAIIIPPDKIAMNEPVSTPESPKLNNDKYSRKTTSTKSFGKSWFG